MKRTHDSQIVRAKDTLKLSQPRWTQPKTSIRRQPTARAIIEYEAWLKQIKKENIAINHDLVYNQTCRL